jgi:hypothetical protein
MFPPWTVASEARAREPPRCLAQQRALGLRLFAAEEKREKKVKARPATEPQCPT